MLQILKAPHDALTTVCEEVSQPTGDHIKTLSGEMRQKLLSVGGLGLAAPQVGWTIRMFIMRYNGGLITCINPEITRRGKEMVKDVEGCLSIPGKRIRVDRNKIIELTYTNLAGERITVKMKGMDARCAQHELDHLNGVLITEK